MITQKSWDPVDRAPSQRSPGTLDAQHVYYVKSNRNAGLMHTAEEGGIVLGTAKEAGFLLYSCIKKPGLVHLGRGIFYRGRVFRLYISVGRKIWWTLHTKLTSSHGPSEGFAIPQRLSLVGRP